MFGTVDVKEVRLGLFRIFWKFRNTLENVREDPQSSSSLALEMKEFKLCGSQAGREFFSSISLIFKEDRILCLVSVRDVFSRRAEDAEDDARYLSIQEQKFLENVQRPSVMWLDGLTVLSDTSDNASDFQFLQKLERGKWQFMQEDSEIGTVIILWIDFGTTETIRQSKMINELAEMFHTQTQCDARFKFTNGQSIGAHIIILSAASPVFAAMFQSSFKESQTREVVIEDIDIQVFQYFLEYLYTCQIPKLAKNEHYKQSIKSLYLAADKYIIEDLKNDCDKLLKQYDEEF